MSYADPIPKWVFFFCRAVFFEEERAIAELKSSAFDAFPLLFESGVISLFLMLPLPDRFGELS